MAMARHIDRSIACRQAPTNSESATSTDLSLAGKLLQIQRAPHPQIYRLQASSCKFREPTHQPQRGGPSESKRHSRCVKPSGDAAYPVSVLSACLSRQFNIFCA